MQPFSVAYFCVVFVYFYEALKSGEKNFLRSKNQSDGSAVIIKELI